MDQENIMFFKNQDKSYTMIDLYLHDRFLGYKDGYNYYDIDVDKIFLFRKSDNEYIIRYNDANKNKTVPLRLKIKNYYFGELHMFTNNITLMLIDSDDIELFRKCGEIWNKITELISINNPEDFVETTLDNGHEFIILNVQKNASAIRYKYRNDIIFALYSVFNNYPQTSYRY